jgi:hypothetical protein
MDPPAEEGISASAAHSCDGHSGGALLMATAAERADLRRTAVLRVIGAVPTVELTFRQRLTETWVARPGNDPPVVPPLVRRI